MTRDDRTTLVFTFDDDPTGTQEKPRAVVYRGNLHVKLTVRDGQQLRLEDGRLVTSILMSAKALDEMQGVLADGPR